MRGITILSERKCRKDWHVSYDTVLGMENAFVNEGAEIKFFSPIFTVVNKVLNKLKLVNLPDVTIKVRDTYVLFICMGISDLEKQAKTLKRLSKQGNNVVLYCFDTWESHYERWEKMFFLIKPKFIFMAYKSSKEYFAKLFENVFFIPQSMDEKYFYPRDVRKKRLIMQMGRKNSRIHNVILNYLHDNEMEDCDENYVYERENGKIIYPDTDELAENICSTKFFVCAAQSLENMALTGKISDVTARFYEAMACKTLIIGYKPDTYDELFLDNSMIELKPDVSDLSDWIKYFSTHTDEYNLIVDRNYDYLMEHHRWKNRFKEMINIINGSY